MTTVFLKRARFLLLLSAICPAVVVAQAKLLKVISTDSVPIPFAYVSIEGGIGQITDEKGEVNLGAGKKKTFTANVRRIGYQPWFGKLELPDTAVVLTVTLSRVAQTLAPVTVQGEPAVKSHLQVTGFYDRWMMRQKGTLSAVFIGPEEIEFRHPDKITNLLSGLNGVTMRRSCEGFQMAMGAGGRCPMAIVVDGLRQCPAGGCNNEPSVDQIPSKGSAAPSPFKCEDPPNAVAIDQMLDANDVTAIEVYSRGGNMPVSLQVSDQACGVIALWTGSRRQP